MVHNVISVVYNLLTTEIAVHTQMLPMNENSVFKYIFFPPGRSFAKGQFDLKRSLRFGRKAKTQTEEAKSKINGVRVDKAFI